VNPGDEVILLEPFFDIYIGAVSLCGGTVDKQTKNKKNRSLIYFDVLNFLTIVKALLVMFLFVKKSNRTIPRQNSEVQIGFWMKANCVLLSLQKRKCSS
jgi:hypothetical protein